jgi:hypothetical protein
MMRLKLMNDVRILVLQRGWVAVGKYTQEGDEAILNQAKIVRRWGTSKGLGEIAENGPTDKTVLDSAGKLRANVGMIVLQLQCEASKWDAHL